MATSFDFFRVEQLLSTHAIEDCGLRLDGEPLRTNRIARFCALFATSSVRNEASRSPRLVPMTLVVVA
jgi:hypothetical protein